MKNPLSLIALLTFLMGCSTSVNISVDSNRPGTRISINGEDVGETPVIKSLGCDTSTYWKTIDGEYYLNIVATPSQLGSVAQTQVLSSEYLCKRSDGEAFKVFFNMNMRPMPSRSQQEIDLRIHSNE